MENPLISIVIPVYNAENYIEETVNNFLNQTYQNLEIIVQEDRSKDATWTVLVEKFGNNPKVKLEQNETNQGIGPNWNRAYDRATGEYVVIANADDIHKSDFVEKALENIKKYQVDFVSFKYEVLFEDSKKHHFPNAVKKLQTKLYSTVFETVFYQNPFHIIYTLFNKKFVDEIKIKDGAFLNTQVCDFELLFRYAFHHGRLFYDETSMGYYRIHKSNNSSIPLAELKSFYKDVVPVWHETLKKRLNKTAYKNYHLTHLKNYFRHYLKGKVPFSSFIIRSCLKYALT